MLFLFAFALALGLAIRSFWGLVLKSTKIPLSLKNFFGCLFFSYSSFLIYRYKLNGNLLSYPSDLLFLASIVFIASLLPKPSFLTQNTLFSSLKWLAYITLSSLTFFLVGLSFYHQYWNGKPILYIEITGNSRSKTLSYDHFGKEMREIQVIEYEVVIKDLSNHLVYQDYIYGDLVALRVKTLNFSPLLTWMGFETCYQLDMIYNGFTKEGSYAKLPIKTASCLDSFNPTSLFWLQFWDHVFFKTCKTFVLTAALQSQYFPLIDKDKKPFRGSFELSLYPSGIGSKKL